MNIEIVEKDSELENSEINQGFSILARIIVREILSTQSNKDTGRVSVHLERASFEQSGESK